MVLLRIHPDAERKRGSKGSRLRWNLRKGLSGGACSILLLAAPAILAGQEPTQEPVEPLSQTVQPESSAAASQLVEVHGVVRNGATGEPLPRALVRIEGDASAGALTDGEGRFEISGVASGLQLFRVLKPGYGDAAPAGDLGEDITGSSMHNVLVAAGMPELAFSLTPRCSIRGRIELSSGDPAHGIGLVLLKRIVQDGRTVWQAASNTRSNSEGNYRFGNLAEGTYVLFTNPAMDSDSITNLVAPGHTAAVARNGYASVFYPDARDFAGAAKIRLANGEQAQANMMLTLEPFYPVSAQILSSNGRAHEADSRFGSPYMVVVTDTAGHQGAYSAQYDPPTQSVQASLPDGTYALQVSTAPFWNGQDGTHGAPPRFSPSITGSTEFAVSGHALSNLRVVLANSAAGLVQLRINRSASAQTTAVQDEEVHVTVSQDGGLFSDGAMNMLASGTETEGLQPSNLVQSGTYWVHTQLAQRSLCEESFTGGGINLAREPLVLSSSAGQAPLDLTLRNDCAKLTLSLPATLAGASPGEEPSLTVFAVPDFDTTEDVLPVTLRASTSTTVTLEGLTPGSYHVYAFSQPVQLEYKNRAVLAALPNPGQQVTLTPGATGSLVVEAPAP